MREDEMIKFPC